jgi:hypothetical protein
MFESGRVARIEVSEHAGNAGRIVDIIGKFDDTRWIVTDGCDFVGYEPGTCRDAPIEQRRYTESKVLCIEAWKLRLIA